jgi:flavin-dependent thymidylate synthase
MNKQLIYSHSDNVAGHEYTVEFWAGEVAEVTLIDHPANARQTLARTTRGYTGRYGTEPMSEEEVAQNLLDLKSTKLGTPAEMLNFVFLVRDVPRSFTHQMVRTRIGASYVQESTRFIGAKDVYKVLVPKTCHDGMEIQQPYAYGTLKAIEAYEAMLAIPGVASQDARNLLPHSLLTNLYVSYTLRALMGVYNVRWCCQAEPSTWLPVMKQMKALIRKNCGDDIADFLTAPIDRNEPCGFDASFDRPCSWKERKREPDV